MKKKTRCGLCRGTGQNSGIKDEKRNLVEVTDCKFCDGIGFIFVEYIDKRKNSKNRKLNTYEEW
jgi:hypothetical protein